MANSNSHAVMAVITSVRPPFRNKNDKVAFAVHASILASGFVLIATGRPAFADNALSASLTQGDVGIEGWNEFDREYAFVYKKPERRSKRILVKCLAMDDKLLVDAIAYGGTEPAHLEIVVGNYAGESREGDYSSQFKNLSKLVTDVQSEILDKLDGRLKLVSSRTRSSSESNEEPRHYFGTRNPFSHQIHPSGSGVVIPPITGDGGCYSDLYPGPGAGMYPGRGGFGDGSMFVGADDPRFFPQIGDRPGFMGPQPGAPPPGARFDPYGPPGVPGFEPGRFIRHPPRRTRGRMHPDLEQFPSGSDFI